MGNEGGTTDKDTGQQAGQDPNSQGGGSGGNAGHNVDKGLQKLQQQQAQDRRTLQEVTQTVNEIRDSLKNLNSSKAQDKGDSLDSVLSGLGEDDVVDAKSLKAALQSVSGSLKEELSSEVKSTLESSLKDVKELTSEQKQQKFWSEWEQSHPNVADQKEKLIEEAEQIVESQPGSAQMTDDQYAAALQSAFTTVVQYAERSTNPPPGKSGSSGSKSGSRPSSQPSDKPPQSTEGTEVTPSGSKTGGGQESNLPPEPGPIWVEDE